MEKNAIRPQKIEKFLKKVFNHVEQIMEESLPSTYAYCSIDTQDGWLEIEMNENGENHVEVFHNKKDEGFCPNLARLIEKSLPEWSDVCNRSEKSYRDDLEFRSYLKSIH